MKKFLCLLVAFVMIMCQCVFADGINIDYDKNNVNLCIISGTDDVVYNTEVTLTILADGKSSGDISDNYLQNDDVFVCVDTTYTDTDGNWQFVWEPDEGGYYNIYVSSVGFDAPHFVEKRFIAADRASLKDILTSGSKSDIEAITADLLKLKSLVLDDKLIDKIKKPGKIADIIFEIRNDLSDKSQTIDYFELACLMQYLNESSSYECLDKIVEFTDSLGYSLTNSDLYSEDASVSVRTNLAKRLSNSVYSGIDNFNKAFGDQLILAAVESIESWSGLDKYLKLLNNSNYKTYKSKVAQGVVKNDFDTISELEDFIKDIVSENSSSKKSGSSGGGGGSFKSVNVVNDSESPEYKEETSPEKSWVTFNDVPETHWAFDYINHLRWNGTLAGDENGNFNSENNVTRAEYVKMLCKVFGISESSAASFEDVGANDWFKGYVSAAKQKGFISGDGVNFYPNNMISRQDMAVMTYNFAKGCGFEFESQSQGFTDFYNVSDYAKEAISFLAGAKIIGGMPDGSVAPLRNLTRAEAAKIIYSILTELVGE